MNNAQKCLIYTASCGFISPFVVDRVNNDISYQLTDRHTAVVCITNFKNNGMYIPIFKKIVAHYAISKFKTSYF